MSLWGAMAIVYRSHSRVTAGVKRLAPAERDAERDAHVKACRRMAMPPGLQRPILMRGQRWMTRGDRFQTPRVDRYALRGSGPGCPRTAPHLQCWHEGRSSHAVAAGPRVNADLRPAPRNPLPRTPTRCPVRSLPDGERTMRVTISTAGRFQPAYVWAAFLDGTDQLERLITPLPYRKVSGFGAPKRRTYSLAPFAAWSYAVRRYGTRAPRRLLETNALLTAVSFDNAVARLLGTCDVFNGWTGSSLASIRRARRRDVPSVLQTGSAHIVTQHDLLQEEAVKYGAHGPSTHPGVIARVLREYQEADTIVVPSPFVHRTFVDQGIAPEKLVVVPWCALPVHGSGERWPPDESRPVTILFVGGCTLRKGLPYLLDAAKALGPVAEVRLVGTPNPSLFARLGGLPRNVTAVGTKTGQGLRDELRNADIFVLPSVEDGSALVTIEAMLAGLPVVVSDQAGPALIKDGESGFIVPACDAGALADRLLLLARDPDARARIGAAGRQVAAPRTPQVYGAELVERVYSRLL